MNYFARLNIAIMNSIIDSAIKKTGDASDLVSLNSPQVKVPLEIMRASVPWKYFIPDMIVGDELRTKLVDTLERMRDPKKQPHPLDDIEILKAFKYHVSSIKEAFNV